MLKIKLGYKISENLKACKVERIKMISDQCHHHFCQDMQTQTDVSRGEPDLMDHGIKKNQWHHFNIILNVMVIGKHRKWRGEN